MEEFEKEENYANKSCPKTPKFEVNSEQFCISKGENTISDSFLEQAFNSHLSEFTKSQKAAQKLEPKTPIYTPSPRSKRLQERRKMVKKAQQKVVITFDTV